MSKPFQGIFELAGAADRILEARCALVLARLGAMGETEALAALADPRAIHFDLYDRLATDEAQPAAGHFRGEDHPLLRDCIVYVSFNDIEGTTDIAGPHEVQDEMVRYAAALEKDGLRRATSAEEKLASLVPLVALFGAAHPFMDGNGHILRITLQILMEKAGYGMTSAWSVHPCPYGEDMHRAFAARKLDAVTAMLTAFVQT